MVDPAPAMQPRPFARKGGRQSFRLDGAVLRVLAGTADTDGRFALFECLARPGRLAVEPPDDGLAPPPPLEGALCRSIESRDGATPTGALILLPTGPADDVGARIGRALLLLVPGAPSARPRAPDGAAEATVPCDRPPRRAARRTAVRVRAAAARRGVELLLLPGSSGSVERIR